MSDEVPAVPEHGATDDRSSEENSRALIGVALSGLGLAWLVAYLAVLSFFSPLLVGLLGIGGVVMGRRGRKAARSGRATNQGLAQAAVAIGIVVTLGAAVLFVQALSSSLAAAS